MSADTIAQEGSSSRMRRLVVVNATTLDQNFGLLARPGLLDVVPDVGAEQWLVWKATFVAGRSEAVTSRGTFVWEERCTFMLGRFGPGSTFLSEATLPLPAISGASIVGFIGLPGNGAAKLLRVESGSAASSVLRTDGSFPPPSARTGTTRHLAFATAIDPDGDDNGAALAIPLASNMVASFEPAPRYWITALAGSLSAGDSIPPEVAAAAHPVVFDGGAASRLVFTDRNTFEPAV